MWVEILVVLLLLAAFLSAWRRRERAASDGPVRGRRPFASTGAHYRRLYSRRNFLKLGGAVAGAAVLVYSGADEVSDAWHRDRVHGPASDRVADLLHSLGERFWFAVWGGFAVIDHLVATTPVTRWGRQSFEAMVVGLPALWTVQRGLGGARPTDDSHGARFVPLADDNAASGHAFIGAIPWLVAARRSVAPAPRAVALALSPWVGWSRINDRKHYLSQVLLGYGIAWEAVKAVEDPTGGGERSRRFTAARELPRPEDRSPARPPEART